METTKYDYYKDQIKQLVNKTAEGETFSIQIRNYSGDKTKWMGVNEESILHFMQFMFDNLPKHSSFDHEITKIFNNWIQNKL